jgi:hypothetical protein
MFSRHPRWRLEYVPRCGRFEFKGDGMTNDPLAALLPVLADTMKFATQALAQSTALAELLVAKGVVTKAELDGRMALGQRLRDDLMAKLDEEIQKQS